MARPCVARRNAERLNVRAASMYQTCGALMLRARMGIRAHPTDYLERPRRGQSGTQPRGCAGQTVRPSPHSISQTWVGKLLLNRSTLTFQLSLVIGGQVKPSPRSHPRSLAQSNRIGERRWRRGRASISLVNLSERVLCGIGRDPWLVVATAGKYGPGDTCELIGERDRQQITMGKTL